MPSLPNPPKLPTIVQKYGGTSLGKLLPTITSSIIPSYLPTANLAILCSARSSTLKSRGTTSLLLEAVGLAATQAWGTGAVEALIAGICEDHVNAAAEAVGEGKGELLREVVGEIQRDCEGVRALLRATSMLGEVSERTTDRVLAVGETLACRIVAATLRSRGLDAAVIILDDIVQIAYGSTSTHDLHQSFKSHPSAFLRGLTSAIASKIAASPARIPVITGFFGAMPGSLIQSVSRGYSDLCAALVAIALSASELQIWKEVDGIFTADPRKIEAARLLATVTTDEAAELTYYGSEVIHPLTIEQIDGAGIPLRLKNVMNPLGEGTIIFPSLRPEADGSGRSTPERRGALGSESSGVGDKTSFMVANGYYGPNQCRRTPTAVTVKESVKVLNIRSHGTTSPQTFLCLVSNTLEQHDIVVDLISSSQQMLSLAVCAQKQQKLNRAIEKLESVGQVSVLENMSIVSVIGHKMRNMVGVGAEIFSALASARVNIYLISQGASEINISFVVSAQDAQLAMQVVHTNVMKIPLHAERETAFAKGPWLY